MRNRINLSRSNYKEPYIRQPCTNARLAESRTAEGRRQTRIEWGGSQRKEEETNEIKGTEIEQHALEEESGWIKGERDACERDV